MMRRQSCVYTAEPDAPPIVSLKRKFEALQKRHDEVSRLLDRLKSGSPADAHELLESLRRGELDEASTMGPAGPTPASDFRGSQWIPGIDHNHRSCVVSLPPLSEILGPSYQRPGLEPPPAILPPILNGPGAKLQASLFSVPVHVVDERLKHARACDWDVSYVDDQGFRNILSSYLTWDHHGHRPFDEDDFLDGLIKRPTDTCSEILVHTILAYGAFNYSHVDPDRSPVIFQAAWSRAQELWKDNIDKESSISSAAASMIMWSVHTLLTDDDLGMPCLLEARHIAHNMGLYDASRADRVYDPLQPRRSRARAICAWGIYSWINLSELAFRTDMSFDSPPPIDPPCASVNATEDWSPWPWPRSGRPIPMLKVETFVAQSRLSLIIKEIVLLIRQSSNLLTPAYQKATLVLYQRIQKCWSSIDAALKVLSESPPHILYLNALYNSAVIELLRPLTTTPSHPSPHAAPLEAAGLAVEPTLSYAASATQSQRILYRFFDELYGQGQVVVLLTAFVVAVAFEILPVYEISPDARFDFLVAMRVIYHGAKQFPVLRYAALGIERAAHDMDLILLDKVVVMMQEIREMIASADQDGGRSKWVVNFNADELGSQESRLSSVIDQFRQMEIEGKPS
ncbi:hypothetical protein KCU62_g9631, partial [Aureobasidium sp. EXF-3399]